MKKIIFAIIILLSVFSFAWAASNEEEHGQLRQNDVRISGSIGELRQNDIRIANTIKEIRDEMKAIREELAKIKQNGGGAGSAEVADLERRITQAQLTANRALAGAYRLSSVQSDGSYADIEAVEAMLTPLEKGNMKPKPFEDGVFAAIRGQGWTYLEKPVCGPLADLSNCATKQDLKAVENKIPNVSGLATKQEVKEAKDKAQDAVDLAEKASETATKAYKGLDKKADQSALDELAGKIPKALDTNGFALKSDVYDESGNPLFAKFCLESSYTTLKTQADELDCRVEKVEKKTAGLQRITSWLVLGKKDQAKGQAFLEHGWDGLRALGWAEPKIREAEELSKKL